MALALPITHRRGDHTPPAPPPLTALALSSEISGIMSLNRGVYFPSKITCYVCMAATSLLPNNTFHKSDINVLDFRVHKIILWKYLHLFTLCENLNRNLFLSYYTFQGIKRDFAAVSSQMAYNTRGPFPVESLGNNQSHVLEPLEQKMESETKFGCFVWKCLWMSMEECEFV